MDEADLSKLEEIFKSTFSQFKLGGAFILYYQRQFEDKEDIWKTTKINERNYGMGLMEYNHDEHIQTDVVPNENMTEEELNKLHDLYASAEALAKMSVQALISLSERATYLKQQALKYLNVDTARLFALEENEVYAVFTENAVFHVSHKSEIWTLKQMDGEPVKLPDHPNLQFIGNVQDDGNIFVSADLPIISTGDRMLFGLRQEELVKPLFISTKVRGVVPLTGIN